MGPPDHSVVQVGWRRAVGVCVCVCGWVGGSHPMSTSLGTKA